MKPEHDETGRHLAGLDAATIALRHFLEAHDELVRRQARRMGMGVSDMLALRLLDAHGPMGPTELARRLDMRSASATVLVDRLVARGVVERRPDPHDRRRVTVRALPRATDDLFDAWAPVVRAIDDIGLGLDAADRAAVCAYLERLATTAYGGPPPGTMCRRSTAADDVQ